jgi:hypothetical protein
VSSEDAAALPSYEDMIVMALAELSDPEGSPPKTVFQWMARSVFSFLISFSICADVLIKPLVSPYKFPTVRIASLTKSV